MEDMIQLEINFEKLISKCFWFLTPSPKLVTNRNFGTCDFEFLLEWEPYHIGSALRYEWVSMGGMELSPLYANHLISLSQDFIKTGKLPLFNIDDGHIVDEENTKLILTDAYDKLERWHQKVTN